MKIAFIWTGFTSYMADAWRALAKVPGVELRIWIDEIRKPGTEFDPSDVMRGLDYSWAYSDEYEGSRKHSVAEDIRAFAPDALFIVGWVRTLPPFAACCAELRDVRKVFCMDMPWRNSLRCIVAPLILRRILRNYGAAFVPGEVSARYARWLGFSTVHKGLFSIDTGRFLSDAPLPPPSERYFLFIGRNTPEKNIGDLVRAHGIYLSRGGKLPLRMCGAGLSGGFVAPADIPALMRGAAAFVLPSSFDPWPLVLLEAMSAGCPVIASDRCTNRPELGRNWRVFPCGDVDALANALAEEEKVPRVRPTDNAELVAPYDSRAWAERVVGIVTRV